MVHGPFNKHVLSWCMLICFTFGFYTTTLCASPDHWPTNGWRSSTPEEQGMDAGKLIEMIETVRDQGYAVDNITIIRNGYLIMDAYVYPFQKNTKHVIHSNTKSITSALVGIALDKGYIKSVNQPVLEFFPETTIANLDAQKRSITLAHLLTMASGLDTKDSYLYKWVGLGDMMASEDWAQYVLDLPMAQAPGERFEYSNGVSYLLAAIIQKTTEMSALEFARQHLFGPLGITDVKWRTSPQGVNAGWGDMMLTPHDMAKIGLLYLQKGRWEDRQIVSTAWIEASTQQQISATLFGGYGYQWWIDSAQYFMAVGYLGQFIFVVPGKNLVVVFTSNLEDYDFFIPKRLLDKYIIPAAVSSQPLAAQPEKTEHLDVLLANLAQAPAQGFIWTSEKNGVAKNGEFIHSVSPAFRFKYPKTSLKQATRFPGQVMAMKTLGGNRFSASIGTIPTGIKLAEVGPRVFASALNEFGSNIEVVSNTKITLADGTAAYRTDINWLWQSSFKLRTLVVSAFHEKKLTGLVWVFLVYSLGASNEADISEDLNEGASIVESLTFKQHK